MNELQVIEYQNQRIMTTEQLAEAYETDITNIKTNFNRNKDKFHEGIHYFYLQGDALKSFKNYVTESNLVDKRAPSLYLWTERGASRHCKILDTPRAWEQFDYLEDAYFRVKAQAVLIQELSPELQMFKHIFDSVAQTQLEQKHQQKALEETNKRIDDIRDVVALNPTSWREDARRLIVQIAHQMGGNEFIRDVQSEIFNLVDVRGGVNLKTRQTNMRQRMSLNGICKSRIDKVNKVDVIAEDKKLIEIYLAVVKEMAIKYGLGQKAG